MSEQESERIKLYPTWSDAAEAAWAKHKNEFLWYESQIGEKRLGELVVARLNAMVREEGLPADVPNTEMISWAVADLVQAGLLPRPPAGPAEPPAPARQFFIELHERGGQTKRLGPFAEAEAAAAVKRYAVHQTAVQVTDAQGTPLDPDTLRPPQVAPPAEPTTEQPEAKADSGPPLLVANRFAHFVRLPGSVFLAEPLPATGGDISKRKVTPDIARAHQFDRAAAAKAAHKLRDLGVAADVVDSRGRRVWPSR